ncbi:MAG: SRPBCC domain-containing protein [Bdellovibrionota bacterium]
MQISKTIKIAQRHEEIFRAISLGELFRSTGILQPSLRLDFRPEGTYSFLWPTTGKCKGIFLVIIPSSLISFTWMKSDALYSKDTLISLVQIRLIPNGHNTLLELIHSDLPEEASYECMWDEVLAIFKRKIEVPSLPIPAFTPS